MGQGFRRTRLLLGTVLTDATASRLNDFTEVGLG